MVRLLILVAILIATAPQAQAFVLMEIGPAKFSEESAGFIMTLNTTQDTVDYVLTMLYPKRDAPKIPLPIIHMNLRWHGPEASKVIIRSIRGMNGSLDTAGQGKSEWRGQSHIMRISNGAGATKVAGLFHITDFKKFQSIGANSILIIASAGAGSNVEFAIKELPIEEILAAPLTSLPSLPMPRPAEPPQKSRDPKWKASLE